MTEKNHDSDVAFIQALAELLNKNDLAELSVKREYGDNDSLNVRVSKYAAPAQVSYAPAPPAAASPAGWMRRRLPCCPLPIRAPTRRGCA